MNTEKKLVRRVLGKCEYYFRCGDSGGKLEEIKKQSEFRVHEQIMNIIKAFLRTTID
jgi:hypothetical protein